MHKYSIFIAITMAVGCKANSQPLMNLAESLQQLNRTELQKQMTPQEAADILAISQDQVDQYQKIVAASPKSVSNMKHMDIKVELNKAVLSAGNKNVASEDRIIEAYRTLLKFLDLL